MVRGSVIVGVITLISLIFGSTIARSQSASAITSDEKWGLEQTINEIEEKIETLKKEREKMSILDKVDYYAAKHGVNNTLAHYVVYNESRYNEKAVGDLYIFRDGYPVYARGLMQITRYYHPNVSDSCAFNADCNLDYGMKFLKDPKTCKQQFSTCRMWYTN